MAIDYDKVNNSKEEFKILGNPANEQYQKAFLEWFDQHKDELEQDLQEALQKGAREGKSSINIDIRAIKMEDYYKVGICIGDYSHTSPANIFKSYQTTEMWSRHYYSEEEMIKQFEWYCEEFYKWFDDIQLRYKTTDIYFDKDWYLLEKVFLPL